MYCPAFRGFIMGRKAKYTFEQKHFHGKTAYHVRQEALAADKPEQYPIAPIRRIERFWEKIQKSKAKHQAQAQQ